MSKPWLFCFLTAVIGAAAFFVGPYLWPMGHDVSMPPPTLLPGYIAVSAIEALAFGFAVAFAVFGWSTIRKLRLGAPWLNGMLFVTLIWFTGNWWIHDNLHMNVGLDMNRLLYIELAFHMTMIACGVVLAIGLMRLAHRAPPKVTELRLALTPHLDCHRPPCALARHNWSSRSGNAPTWWTRPCSSRADIGSARVCLPRLAVTAR